MGILDHLEHRLGIRSAFVESMSGKRPPAGIGFLRCLGFAALTVLVLQFLSGIALALHYQPSVDLAYDSIRAFEQDIAYGRLVRGLHHYGASAFVVFVALHMLRVYFTGAYKAPREYTWLTGMGLLLLVLGFGFTGYLLPWDQKAYFATKVGCEIASDTPVVGAQVADMLRGGDEVGQGTLTRFYVIHVVLLPLGLLGLLGLHLYLIQRHSVAPPGLPVGVEGPKGPPYFPYHTFKEAVVGVVVALALFVVATLYPAELGDLANPADTEFQPRPDWYFLGLFQLLKLFPTNREIGTFYIPAAFVGILVLLPFVDRTRARHWKSRPIATLLGGLACIVIVGLTAWGGLADRMAAKPDDAQQPAAEDEYKGPDMPMPRGLTNFERRGYQVVRQQKCIHCHETRLGETSYGRMKYRAPGLHELESEDAIAMFDYITQPDSDDMPAFGNLPAEDRLAAASFLMWLRQETEKKDK